MIMTEEILQHRDDILCVLVADVREYRCGTCKTGDIVSSIVWVVSVYDFIAQTEQVKELLKLLKCFEDGFYSKVHSH